MGYRTVNAVENLGMLFYTLVFILIVYGFIMLVKVGLQIMKVKEDSKIWKIVE